MGEAAKSAQALPVICVLGSWSSGTSAVAGYIAKAGAYSCPPHFRTNDPRTPATFEATELQARCNAVIDEGTLRKRGSIEAFQQWLGPWLREKSVLAREAGYDQIVIKHPLLMMLVRSVEHVCNAKWVMVTRPLDKIEATRKRRGWRSTLGEEGAKTLYPAAFSALVALEQSYVTVSFPHFLQSPEVRTALLQSLALGPDEDRKADAEGSLRLPVDPASNSA